MNRPTQAPPWQSLLSTPAFALARVGQDGTVEPVEPPAPPPTPQEKAQEKRLLAQISEGFRQITPALIFTGIFTGLALGVGSTIGTALGAMFVDRFLPASQPHGRRR